MEKELVRWLVVHWVLATVTQTGVSSIPIVGWVIGGAISMFGMDQGAEIGGQMAVDFADCDEETITGEN